MASFVALVPPLLLALPLLLPLLLPLPVPLLSPLFAAGEGGSSFDLRFSERGGSRAVGEVAGVLKLPPPVELLLLDPLPLLPDEEFVDTLIAVELAVVVEVEVVVEVGADVDVLRPPRPLAPAFRNLL